MKTILDKKLFIILFAFFLVFNSFNIAKKVIFKYFYNDWPDLSWTQFLFELLFVRSFTLTLLVLFVAIITKKMMSKKYKMYSIFLIHVGLSVMVLILVQALILSYYIYSGQVKGDDFLNQITINVLYSSDTNFLMYFSFVFIVYIYYYIQEVTAIELQKANLKQQLTSVQMNVLKYQLHPHFFFNTLNSISTLIETDTKLAQNTLADFSDLLRDILFLKDSNLMPLSLEIKILKRYLDIMSVRFSDHLEIKINVAPNLENVLIPSLILQPIVENSIKHGYSYDSTELEICITILENENYLKIIVENNGEPMKDNVVKFGTGLKNTEERLQTLYHDDFQFTIKNREQNKGVKTVISFPIKRE